jgi:hypothetical protein
MWPIVGGAIGSAAMTALVAIIVFFRAPESQWLYASLKYTLAFMGGFLTFALLLVLLALLGARRRKLVEKDEAKLQKYATEQKGNLDYRAELKPVGKQFQSGLRETGREISRVGKRANRIALWMTVFASSPALMRWSAARGAKAMIKGAQKMERNLLRLEERTTVYLDIVTGNAKLALPASQGNREALLAARAALMDVDTSLNNVMSDLRDVRSSASAVIGQQQTLDTAVNYLNDMLEGNIRALGEARSGMLIIFRVLDNKLNS